MKLAKSSVTQKSHEECSPCSRCPYLTVQRFFHHGALLFPECIRTPHCVGGIFKSGYLLNSFHVCHGIYVLESGISEHNFPHGEPPRPTEAHTSELVFGAVRLLVSRTLRTLRVIESETQWCASSDLGVLGPREPTVSADLMSGQNEAPSARAFMLSHLIFLSFLPCVSELSRQPFFFPPQINKGLT